ncbi:MAG TPA: hypothetical protein VEP89_08685 [Draconibacterium sp.]|nr:hypothetical protein [Draconibacterium sp.]
MQKLFFIALFIVTLLACQDREAEPIIVPGWIKPRLVELTNSEECNGCRVQRWTYNEEYFYHLYCDDWSCLDCEVYHYDGTPVEWDVTVDHADFNANKHRPILIWECGDDLDL